MMWTDPVMKFISVSEAPRRIIGVVADVDDGPSSDPVPVETQVDGVPVKRKRGRPRRNPVPA